MKRTAMLTKALAAALLLAFGAPGFAGDEVFDIDPRFRARIAKEKVKQAARERQNDKSNQGIDDVGCGSQNIGNVDTGGKPGAAPREVFVFAPNAINLVTGNGCR